MVSTAPWRPLDYRLADVPLLAGLPPAALDALLAAGRIRTFPAGQILFVEGDPGDALVILEKGQLRIGRVGPNGDEAVLAVVEAPAALGELALLDDAPRDATVTAQRAVSVRLIPQSVFRDLLRREPALVDGLLRTLAELVRQGNARHADYVRLDVPGRLAKWLLRRATVTVDPGAHLPPGVTIAFDRSQGELAAELGTTRSTLNRALQSFVDLGLIEVTGDAVTLLDLGALAACAG